MEPWIRAQIVVPDHTADRPDTEPDSYHLLKEWAPCESIRSHFWLSKTPIPMVGLAQYFEEMKSSCLHYLQRYAVDKGSNELLFRLVTSFSGADLQASFQSIIQSEFVSVSFFVGNYEIKFSILSCKLIAELQEWMAIFNSSSQVTIVGISMDCKTLSGHVKRTQSDPSEDLHFNRVHAMRLGGAVPISTSFQENCRLVNIARGAMKETIPNEIRTRQLYSSVNCLSTNRTKVAKMSRILQMKNRTEARMILTRVPAQKWTNPQVMETWIEDNLENAKRLRARKDLSEKDITLTRSDFMQTASEILCIANCYGHETADLKKLDFLCRTALCFYVKSNLGVEVPTPHEICLHLTDAAVESGLWDCDYGTKVLTDLRLPGSQKLATLESWIASGDVISSGQTQVEALCRLEDIAKTVIFSTTTLSEELNEVGEKMLRLFNVTKALL